MSVVALPAKAEKADEYFFLPQSYENCLICRYITHNNFVIQKIIRNFAICNNAKRKMRIFTEKPLKEYADRHPEAKTAIQDWIRKVNESKWQTFADIKRTFNSVDYVGNQHYVFNIKGNDYRLVVVVQFRPQFVYIRFIGTHAEYDRIDCSTI